jgi:integrative and conjugative element protein (TIGR02256 family)
MTERVIFSDRAYAAIITETLEKITTETGGVFLGYYKDKTWYVIESIDPGPKSIFSSVTFEYDQEYINHLINKINKLYQSPLNLIGLWHRHPGSMDSFSSTDDGTNLKYAQINTYGAISAIVNIDPIFRITVYRVSPKFPHYARIDYDYGDKYIPKELMQYVATDELLRKMDRNFKSRLKKTEKQLVNLVKNILKKASVECYDETVLSLLHGKFSTPVSDNDIDEIIEELEEDVNYLAEISVNCGMSKTKDGILQLYGVEESGLRLWVVDIFKIYEQIYFCYDQKPFRYKQGLFRSFD